MMTMIRKPIDITSLEEKNAEIHPLKAAFDAMDNHVIITDENANILYANRAVEKNTGYKREEILGKNPGDFWGGKMPKDFYEKMWYRIKIEKEPFVGEVQNERKDGGKYWQELHISPILDKRGEIKFFIGIEPNITKKKILEAMREKFISAFDKKIQNSFDGSRNIMDWLNTNGKLTRKEQDKLEALYKQQQNLAILVSDLLAFINGAE